MHYSAWVIVDDKDDVSEAIAKVLDPYDENGPTIMAMADTSDWPDFTWDWYQIGGRWSGMLTGNEYGDGYSAHPDDIQPVEGFGCERFPYFIVTNDGAWCKELRNPEFADDWSNIAAVPWHIDNPEFGKQVVAALRAHPFGTVVVVDVHR